MKFDPACGELKSSDPKDVARLIYDFFRYQYEKSVESDIVCRSEIRAAEAANKSAEDEYKSEGIIGFGPRLPYDERCIEIKRKNSDEAKKQRADAKVCLDFVVNRLIDVGVSDDKL